MLRDGGYRRTPSPTEPARSSRPAPRAERAVAYGLEGLVLSADVERCEVFVEVHGGLRAEPFVGRCITARLARATGAIQDRGGRCELTLADLHVGDRVEIRTRLSPQIQWRPPARVEARQVILLDPRCTRRVYHGPGSSSAAG